MQAHPSCSDEACHARKRRARRSNYRVPSQTGSASACASGAAPRMIQPSIFVEPHTAELPLEFVVEIVCVLQHPTQRVAELVIIEKVAEQCVLEEDARAVLVIGHKCERSEPMIAGAERDMPMQRGFRELAAAVAR